MDVYQYLQRPEAILRLPADLDLGNGHSAAYAQSGLFVPREPAIESLLLQRAALQVSSPPTGQFLFLRLLCIFGSACFLQRCNALMAIENQTAAK